MGTVFAVLNLIMRVLQVVHSIEKALPGAPGAEKSAAVIAKVTPIAETIGLEQENIQAIIDVGVSLFNKAGVFNGTADGP